MADEQKTPEPVVAAPEAEAVDTRKEWVRPELRRLGADLAQMTRGSTDKDGPSHMGS